MKSMRFVFGKQQQKGLIEEAHVKHTQQTIQALFVLLNMVIAFSDS